MSNEAWLKKAKWIAFGVLLLVVAIIVFRNLEETKVELIFATVTMPLAALLTITLLVGFALGFSANALWRVRHWRSKSREEKKESAAPPQSEQS